MEVEREATTKPQARRKKMKIFSSEGKWQNYLTLNNRNNGGEHLDGYRQQSGGEDGEALEDDYVEDIAQGSDEGEGDDLMDNMEADYDARPELDNYEQDGLDD